MTQSLDFIPESVWPNLLEPSSLSLRCIDHWVHWLRIVHQGGVCGGRARIKGTRIPVWVLKQYWDFDATDEDILAGFPSLAPEDLEEAKRYIEVHPEEIQQDILDQDEE